MLSLGGSLVTHGVGDKTESILSASFVWQIRFRLSLGGTSYLNRVSAPHVLKG